MFAKLIKKFLFVIHCRILIGADPVCVKCTAIIFFPLLPSVLNCGFAGLMTVKLPAKNYEPTLDLKLIGLWQKIKTFNLKSVLAGRSKISEYLNGWQNLQEAENAVLELKREDAQEFYFFRQSETKKFIILSKEIKKFLNTEEKNLEDNADKFNSPDLEIINSRIVLLKDIQWILEKDILANFGKIIDLSGKEKEADVKPAEFRKYRKINLLLNALDRLEVRGRDSAGLQITLVPENAEPMATVLSDLKKDGLYDTYVERSQAGDLLNGSIQIYLQLPEENKERIKITFTYKTFSIVGELGRNVRELRRIIRNDRIFRYFAGLESVCETAITHTRWASVGSITEENCHPVNNYKRLPDQHPPITEAAINVVLNGDIDNYPVLRSELETDHNIIAPEVTTDTKIIPLQIEKYLQAGNNLEKSFRLAVNNFAGSHAIVMTCDLEPGKVFLALKGSGQSIYIGVGEDQYMLSSELYGLIEVMPEFVKMNGEASNADNKTAAGQIFILDQNSCGGPEGITAYSYDGTEFKLTQNDIQKAQITTRDIDRGDYPHFFLKEISESALSVRRTLRGKYRTETQKGSGPEVIFNLGEDIIPEILRRRFRENSIKRIMIIGHGTAAVAGMVVAEAFERYLEGAINVTARVASELSGFLLDDDLAGTLIIPITQSGTTTDTNRAVTMAKERGAFIISIVNRRQSDVTSKSHGVFYTSDGRDIEMSVASTKAFYSQIVAGQILALYFAQLTGVKTNDYIAAELHNLETVPQLMTKLFSRREQIARTVNNTFDKKYWAVVGSGPNKAAADEIRIKLSELCYKTISSDFVENKKHIDLSAEPFILVCSAGNPESVTEDIAKDVAIFKAHKAAVVVCADEGDDRFNGVADAVISIPRAALPLPVILNTLAGHLWGYYAACSIDQGAQILREFRSRVVTELVKRAKMNLTVFDMISDVSFCRIVDEFYYRFKSGSQSGALSFLSGKIIADLLLLMKYTTGKLPLQDICREFKIANDLADPFDLLDVTLGAAIDELTRPIDAIRHQAKTVTVGTSRKEREIRGIIFDLLETLHFPVRNLTYRNIQAIHRIQPAITAVRGYTLYEIGGLDAKGHPMDNSTITVNTKGGIAALMKSRADYTTALMGVKRTIVGTGHLYLGRGKTDGAAIMIIPLHGSGLPVSNLLLLHVVFNEAMKLQDKIQVLGYRYDDIRNLINEYNLTWNDACLDALSMEFLFGESVEEIAGTIKVQHTS
ncbi:MAG: Glutamine--fructose-6-phosphate aminotransferase (isomerizing) [Smithella sp. PtaU1.Bin162]|nr:MAG: Glutamine--fructose-6-phosphate aminotransferase (isomerizing) [Smithella sp. PtaU1.Bin162]